MKIRKTLYAAIIMAAIMFLPQAVQVSEPGGGGQSQDYGYG